MVQNLIIRWYLQNKRDLPWRSTRDPYRIWISEIILQQTKVNQGLPYYNRFLVSFPTIKELAEASESDVLRLWQGLGYYSRGRNLHETAKLIVNELNGVFPNSFSALKKLKGVGDYTAAAIASFAFDECVAAIDGNVMRVIARIFKIEEPIDQPLGRKIISEVSQNLISEVSPAVYNQAMMELGALVCTPKSPQCQACPANSFCLAFRKKIQMDIPVKAKKTKVIARDIFYLVLSKGDKYFLKKRNAKDIWEGLYDFPEVSKEIINRWLGEANFSEVISDPVSHILSHRKLMIYFVEANVFEKLDRLEGEWYSLEEIEQLPKPKVLVDYFAEIKSSPFATL